MLKDALVHAWRLDGRGGGTPLAADALRDGPPAGDGGLVWVHLERTAPETERWLEIAAIPEHAREALLAEETRPRCETWGDGVLVNLRGVNLNPGAEPEDMLALRLWATPSLVVSLRRFPVMAVREVHERLGSGRGPVDAGQLLADLAEGLTDRMAPVIDELEEELETIEDQVEDDADQVCADALGYVRGTATTLRRFIAPQQTALARLPVAADAWMSEADRESLRQSLDDVTRFVEDLDALRERAGIVKDQLAQRQADRMNRAMYRLSLVAGVFLPLGFLTGLLGINVGGMPGTDDGDAFWVVCGVLAAVIVLEVVLLRWRRWL